MEGESAHASQSDKSRALIKFLKAIFDTDSFEQQCVIIKGLLQFEQLLKHMVAIVVDQSLSNSVLYEHSCLENINKLYKTIGKCENQKQYKTNIKSEMVSTPEGYTNNSPTTHNPSVSTKNTISRK